MNNLFNTYPRATEKAYGQSKSNIYVFDVPMTINKNQIVSAIESQFNVKIDSIKTMIKSGKSVRASRGKRARPGIATRKDIKKAYVTLAKGFSIKLFDEPADNKKTKSVKSKELK